MSKFSDVPNVTFSGGPCHYFGEIVSQKLRHDHWDPSFHPHPEAGLLLAVSSLSFGTPLFCSGALLAALGVHFHVLRLAWPVERNHCFKCQSFI